MIFTTLHCLNFWPVGAYSGAGITSCHHKVLPHCLATKCCQILLLAGEWRVRPVKQASGREQIEAQSKYNWSDRGAGGFTKFIDAIFDISLSYALVT